MGKVKNIPQYYSLVKWEDNDIEIENTERSVDLDKG